MPDKKRYTAGHEWILVEQDQAKIGITEYTQGNLGEISYIRFPPVGTVVEQGDTIAILESLKSATEVSSPMSGTVVAINDILSENPALINRDPEGLGWIVCLKLRNLTEFEQLFDNMDYQKKFIKNNE